MVEFPQPEGSGHSRKRPQQMVSESGFSEVCGLLMESSLYSPGCRPLLATVGSKTLTKSHASCFLPPPLWARGQHNQAPGHGRSSPLLCQGPASRFHELLCCLPELWGFILAPGCCTLTLADT